MAKAIVHATSSAKRYGGTPDDYLAIHEAMDSSKEVVADNRHRVLTHHMWFVKRVLQRIFGDYIVVPTTDKGHQIADQIKALEDTILALKQSMIVGKHGRAVSVAQIGEDHILEDFGNKYIPTPADYIISGEFRLAPWMQNGVSGYPPSFDPIAQHQKSVTRTYSFD